MAHLLSPGGVNALMHALGGACSVPLAEGEVRVICAPLPGRSIVSATRRDGVLWICLDLDKPSAHRHAAAMLREWRELYLLDSDGQARPATGEQPTVMQTVPLSIPRLREAVVAMNAADVPVPRRGERPCPTLVS